VEWYDDVNGRGVLGGTGFMGNYYEATVGINYHPCKYLQFRPELREDWADHLVFGTSGADPGTLHYSQLTAACDCIIAF